MPLWVWRGGALRFDYFQGELKAEILVETKDHYCLVIAKFSDIFVHLQRNRKGLKSRSEPNFQYGGRYTWLRYGALPHK